MKAVQAFSEIIHLDRLIATLMQVVIEGAGAKTGALVLLEEDQLTVVAQCSGNRPCGLEKLAVADCATIPVSVIHSVERTQETLVLDDAVSEPPFSTDPYIQHHQTRSLLCLPILNQSQLIGILYLENNLSTGVFTNDRLQVLNLLIAQAAISLENARLYAQLADYTETLERKVEAQPQALQQEIAERQQTEAALRQSEANYRNLIQTANSIILRCDPQGRIHYMNDYGLRFLGYEEHEILGRTLLETIVPETEISGRDRKQFIQDLLRNPASYSHAEGENLCRDGRRVWVAWSNQAILDEQGQIVEILSVGNDITQRKQAEEALQRSEAKFRAIFENSQIGIFRVRISDGLILDANQRFANLYGFDSPQEMIGLESTTSYYVNPSDRQQFLELLKREGEVRSYEAHLRKRDGTVFWGLFSSYLNAADGYIEGVIADISIAKRLEEGRKQAEEALQRSEAKFRTIFENSQVGIYRTRTCDGLILNANQRFADLLGFDSPEEIIGLEHTTGFNVNPNDRQQFIEVLKRDGEVRSYEIQMRKRDGTSFWGLFSSYLNAGDDYIEGVLADISDRKHAEAALQTSEERLRLALTAANQGLYDLNIETEEVVVSPEYALMLGYDPATFYETKSGWIESLHPDDRESVVATYDACITGEVPNYQAEYRQRTQGGQWKWILAVGKIVSWNESGEPIRALGVVTDIDARKQAEAALQASESKLRTLIEAIPDPLFVLTAEGRFLEIIVQEPNLLWQPIEEMIGKTMHQLEKEQADEFLGYIQQVLRTQQILTVEYSYTFLNGREAWFSARIAPIDHDQVIWLTRDITAQKQAEAASILEERNRMAREIHDTLAQAFTGILAQVGAANQVLADDLEATQAHLDLIKELARTGLTEARRSVVALRPQLLEEGSLQSALHRLITQTRAAANDTTLYYETEGTAYTLPPEVESNLLRIGQEALTNAIRHANADEIRVELIYEHDQFLLRVKDNGQGFGVGSIPSSEGFGLLGMSERSERIDTQLRIESQPGQGTEIIVTVDREASR
jgi:PAS domain S-box-containing protein